MGSAWHPGVNFQSVTVCPHCHRIKPPILDHYALDEDRWDGSDFMHVDLNPNKVIVTERVCDCLRAHNFTNWLCEQPISVQSLYDKPCMQAQEEL